MPDAASSILSFIGKILFPSYCLSCGRETPEMPGNRAWLCAACTHTLTPFPHTICPSCGVRTLDGRLDDTCREKTALTKFFCPYPLEQKAVRALVYTYKYRHAATLAPAIALLVHEWLARQEFSWGRKPIEVSDGHKSAPGSHMSNDFLIEPVGEKYIVAHMTEPFAAPYIIIPVPLHTKRFRERGFNQAELLAKHLAGVLGVPVCTDVLMRIKPTQSQLEAQNKEARAKNMRDAFAVLQPSSVLGLPDCPRTEKKIVILVDDVYTTGATMQACARVLRAAGAREVWGMAFARG